MPFQIEVLLDRPLLLGGRVLEDRERAMPPRHIGNNDAVWCGYSALQPRLGKEEPEAEPMHHLRLAGTPVVACAASVHGYAARLSRTRASRSNMSARSWASALAP